MRNRYPFEVYAQYLVATGAKDPAERLRRDGFVFNPADDFLEVTETVRNPPNLKEYSRKAVRFLQEHKLYGLVMSGDEPEVLDAFELLRSPRTRQVLEMLLILNLPNDEVVQLLETGTRRETTVDTVANYRHAFWDVENMTMYDWQQFLFSDSGLPMYPNAVNLRMFLFIPAPLALWKMGYWKDARPTDKGAALDCIFNMAYVKCLEADATGDIAGFRQSASVALGAYEASRTTAVDAEAVIRKLRAIRIGSTDNLTPLLSSATGGQHSVLHNVVQLPIRDDSDA